MTTQKAFERLGITSEGFVRDACAAFATAGDTAKWTNYAEFWKAVGESEAASTSFAVHLIRYLIDARTSLTTETARQRIARSVHPVLNTLIFLDLFHNINSSDLRLFKVLQTWQDALTTSQLRLEKVSAQLVSYEVCAARRGWFALYPLQTFVCEQMVARHIQRSNTLRAWTLNTFLSCIGSHQALVGPSALQTRRWLHTPAETCFPTLYLLHLSHDGRYVI